MTRILEEAMQYGSTDKGIDFRKVQEYLNSLGLDKRYKIFCTAATCVNSKRQDGFIVYRKVKYYFEQKENEVTLERGIR